MKYRKLGNTDLDVSLIGLGTMTYGEQNSEADAHAQLDLALELGKKVHYTEYQENSCSHQGLN